MPNEPRYRLRYLPALTSFDRVRDPQDHVVDNVLPVEPGTPHIVERFTHRGRWTTEPEFGHPPDYFTALCGRTVKVILKQDVDLGDPDICQPCVSATLERQREREARPRPFEE